MSIISTEQIDRVLQVKVHNQLVGKKVPALKFLDVRVENYVVTLNGSVRSYFAKQLAVHCCEHVEGVTDVVDEIQVF